MILVKVSVTASTNSLLTAPLTYTLTTTDSATGNTCNYHLYGSNLQGTDPQHPERCPQRHPSGSFAATATGNPGQILEYRVTVTNTGGQGSAVIVTDAVPAYTTLVTHSAAAYGDGTCEATRLVCPNQQRRDKYDITRDSADSETQPLPPWLYRLW